MAFFEDTFTLSASEADLHRRMKLSAVLRHMQDAASRHLDALGYPYEKLMENRQVFLRPKWRWCFPAVLRRTQKVTAYTRPHPSKGAFFLRETQLAVEGHPMVLGKAAWILADYDTHQVLRPSAFGWDYPFDQVDFDGEIARPPHPRTGRCFPAGTAANPLLGFGRQPPCE